jgi:hypothetical protein
LRASTKNSGIFLATFFATTSPAGAADLQPQTAQAYERYIRLTQERVDSELAQGGGHSLWFERLSEPRRSTAQKQLLSGEIIVERLETLDDGKHIEVPGGIIHHWVGTAFVPLATLAQTVSFMKDYEHKVDYFKPDIVRSKVLRQEGDDYFVLLRFQKTKIVTTVIDTDQEISYHKIDSTHAWSRSRATRVQEVEDAGKTGEKLEPEGHDRGFLWRMNTYWRFEEKDGGTYVECQAISLTRDIPTGLGWMVGPFVTTVPKESLMFTLVSARDALIRQSPANLQK